MKTISDAFRENLARLVPIHAPSIYELAEDADVMPSTIYRLISGGRKNPTIETVDAIAKAMNVNPIDLITETVPEKIGGVEKEALKRLVTIYKGKKDYDYRLADSLEEFLADVTVESLTDDQLKIVLMKFLS